MSFVSRVEGEWDCRVYIQAFLSFFHGNSSTIPPPHQKKYPASLLLKQFWAIMSLMSAVSVHISILF